MSKRKQRKELMKELYNVARRSAVEHFHTNNPPEHAGWIIKETNMNELRRVLALLDRL